MKIIVVLSIINIVIGFVAISSTSGVSDRDFAEEQKNESIISIELVYRSGSCESCGPALLMVQNAIQNSGQSDVFKIVKILVVERMIEENSESVRNIFDHDSCCTSREFEKINNLVPQTGVYIKDNNTVLDYISIASLKEAALRGIYELVANKIRRHAVFCDIETRVRVHEDAGNIFVNPKLEMVANDAALVINYKGSAIFLVSVVDGNILNKIVLDYRSIDLHLTEGEDPITKYSVKDSILVPKESVNIYTAVIDEGVITAVALTHRAQQTVFQGERVVEIAPCVYILKIELAGGQIISSTRVKLENEYNIDPHEAFIHNGMVYFTSRYAPSEQKNGSEIVWCSLATGKQEGRDRLNDVSDDKDAYRVRRSIIVGPRVFLYSENSKELYEYRAGDVRPDRRFERLACAGKTNGQDSANHQVEGEMRDVDNLIAVMPSKYLGVIAVTKLCGVARYANIMSGSEINGKLQRDELLSKLKYEHYNSGSDVYALERAQEDYNLVKITI